jgi:hypothetical protein
VEKFSSIHRNAGKARVVSQYIPSLSIMTDNIVSHGGWPRSFQTSQTLNEGAPGPSHLATGETTDLDRTETESQLLLISAPVSGFHAPTSHAIAVHLPTFGE